MDQTNVKSISIQERGKETDFIKISLVPKFDVIGPLFKKDAATIAKVIRTIDAKDFLEKLSKGKVTLNLAEGSFDITPEFIDVNETCLEGWGMAQFSDGRVLLNREISEDLQIEGLARGMIRRFQAMRKELDLHETEQVVSWLQVPTVQQREQLQLFRAQIQNEIRASELLIVTGPITSTPRLTKEWKIQEEEYKLSIE